MLDANMKAGEKEEHREGAVDTLNGLIKQLLTRAN